MEGACPSCSKINKVISRGIEICAGCGLHLGPVIDNMGSEEARLNANINRSTESQGLALLMQYSHETSTQLTGELLTPTQKKAISNDHRIKTYKEGCRAIRSMASELWSNFTAKYLSNRAIELWTQLVERYMNPSKGIQSLRLICLDCGVCLLAAAHFHGEACPSHVDVARVVVRHQYEFSEGRGTEIDLNVQNAMRTIKQRLKKLVRTASSSSPSPSPPIQTQDALNIRSLESPFPVAPSMSPTSAAAIARAMTESPPLEAKRLESQISKVVMSASVEKSPSTASQRISQRCNLVTACRLRPLQSVKDMLVKTCCACLQRMRRQGVISKDYKEFQRHAHDVVDRLTLTPKQLEYVRTRVSEGSALVARVVIKRLSSSTTLKPSKRVMKRRHKLIEKLQQPRTPTMEVIARHFGIKKERISAMARRLPHLRC